MINRLFSITLNSEGVFAPSDMYYRIVKGNANHVDGKIAFTKGAKVDFDTYFNCLSFSKYKANTTLKKVELQLNLKGEFRVDVIARKLTTKYENEYTFGDEFDEEPLNLVRYSIDQQICTKKFKCEQESTKTIVIDLDSLTGDGLVYISLTCLSLVGEFISGSFNSIDSQNFEPKIAIGICTYKREKFVYDTLDRISKFLDAKPEYKKVFSVYLVDNGNTLSGVEKYAFTKLIKNKNLGGSGGFTRAIYEIKKGDFTHFLLMDDDVCFNTVVLEKTYGLIAYAKEPSKLAIGGSMMTLGVFNQQIEFGAVWTGDKLRQINRNYNLSDPTFVALNEWEERADYNAWWFTCMPLNVTEKGLPLPFFIKGDDIEYGLRFDGKFLAINGLGVWHEDFDQKYNGALEYYIKRNEMIINALYRKRRGAFFHVKKLARSIASQLIAQRYNECDIILKAYNDFMKGPKFLLNTDGEKLHQTLSQMSTKQYSSEQIKELGYDVDREYYKPPEKKTILGQFFTLNGYLLPTCAYNKDEVEKGRLVRLGRTKPKDFYKSSVTIQYNKISDRGMVTKLRRSKLITVGFRLVGVSVKTLFMYHLIRRKYKKYFNVLTSDATWQRLLEIENTKE